MMSFSSFRVRLAVLCAVASLVGAGCLGGTTTTAGPDGGVYRLSSVGDAQQWKQLKVLNLATKFGSIANIGTASYAFDPQDPETLYVGSTENGLLVTYDQGESWQQMKGMSVGRISAVAVDPKNKCVVYAARTNQLFKTVTCGRDWNQVFFDPRTDKTITSIAIDWFHPETIYAGSTDGDLFQSQNAGATWKTVHRVAGVRVMSIVVDPRDSRMVYVATNGAGILKTTDGGATWTAIRKEFEDYEKARYPRLAVLDPNTANRVYHLSKFGLLRSDDGGATWKALSLTTPNNSVDIKAFAVHPKDPKKIVYATDTSIVFSVDGGETWTPKTSPTKRGPSFLQFSSGDAPLLYLGALAPPK